MFPHHKKNRSHQLLFLIRSQKQISIRELLLNKLKHMPSKLLSRRVLNKRDKSSLIDLLPLPNTPQMLKQPNLR